MANNFNYHYPRYEVKTPKHDKELISRIASLIYPENYDSQTGVLKFINNSNKDRLKQSVAPINDELKEKFPRIKFFEQSNPGWTIGEELCCIAKMTFFMPLKYQYKHLKKPFLKVKP